jgi:hypothetical protein
VSISARDRKRLWGKSGGRCAICRCVLFHIGEGTDRPEAVVGEEAHIIGERPGAARYRQLPTSERDAYPNRILLCRNDHVIVDTDAEHWTVERLVALKDDHERAMTALTADRRADGIDFDMPTAVLLETVMTGQQLLDIVGPAFAYVFDQDDLEGESEHEAAKALLDEAHDAGEVYSMLSPGERLDVAKTLGAGLLDALRDGLLLRGARIEAAVTYNGLHDRWPVSILHLRRAEVVAAEQAAAKAADQALREGGIEALEVWSKAARAESERH